MLCTALALGCAAATPSLAIASPVSQPDLVDRIVAVVNGEVITLSQLRRALRLERAAGDAVAGAPAAPPADDEAAFERRVLDTMIDDLLVFQHVRRFPQYGAPQEEIDEQLSRLVASYGSREAFEADLERQGRSAAEVRYDLERRALIDNYIDARYRSITEVRESEMRRYYDEVFVPEMQRQGASIPPFEAVADMIRPILVETEVNRRVESWIVDLRRRADIVVYLW